MVEPALTDDVSASVRLDDAHEAVDRLWPELEVDPE